MTVAASVYDIATTAVRIDTAGETDARDGSEAIILNSGTGTVYLGGPDVTSDDGFPVGSGDFFPRSIELVDAEGLYAICATATTATVHVLETGL